ncbi:nucleotidyltransferase [Bacillus sp. AFS054943]|uniref:Nucleotidyltransferase n=1 Tax=Bacillus cereus TaxID=1396 RepID=A0A2C1LPL8_BACCE|nr:MULTISPECIES: nucleotidyltransferase domain-containing protein [Bacillus]MBE7123141.1 nucleotidyltransferase domain-containing protein [Bacillus cereus]PGL78075.1 nucleotidyltransferase [Bacillus sp. AFS054943]PGT99861.1 nucleotidyltransferase [Bacillus cereus]TKI38691.1 nucleotidyltransferase domain-containing protein [Bacillus mycoides]
MSSNVQKELDQLVNKITDSVSAVNKIILFGSHAYGTPNKNSDFDLCVVVDDNEKRTRDTRRDIHRGIFDILDTPVDLLVYRPDVFNERAGNPVTLEYKIASEGKVLYETSH